MNNERKADDGGPAFPSHETSDTYNDQQGMTLRDYFAGKALQGLCASFPNVASRDLRMFIDEAPATAYMLADAMLRARQS